MRLLILLTFASLSVAYIQTVRVWFWRGRSDHHFTDATEAKGNLARELHARKAACFAAYARGMEMGAELQSSHPSPHPKGHRVSWVDSIDEFAPVVVEEPS